jgi:hypothetical protein
MVFSGAAAVFVEGDVSYPMEVIRDGPMGAPGREQKRRIGGLAEEMESRVSELLRPFFCRCGGR